MREDILNEFSGLTNEQVYVKVFSDRMMRPVPNRPGEFLGTDQRIDFLPYIQQCVKAIPANGQVFDVGAGAGDVVNFALKDAPNSTTINIEEPSPTLVAAYLNNLKKQAHLNVGTVYEGPIQDYYNGKSKAYPQKPQDLILAIHMIYHLTDFTQAQINPEKDLIDAITFLYDLLAPKGSIFIVYADLLDSPQGEAVCGMAEKYFRQHYPQSPFADNLQSIYKARNQLLGPNGSIHQVLAKHFPNTIPALHSQRRVSHFFGKSPEEIAVLGLATELCPSDNKPFNLSKLQFCLDYVAHYPERIGLQKEERDVPQRGLWRADEPQVIAIIKKELY